MRKQLTPQEYEMALQDNFDVVHFMGGISSNSDKIIYLTNNGIFLCDKTDDNSDLEAIQRKESEDYFNSMVWHDK